MSQPKNTLAMLAIPQLPTVSPEFPAEYVAKREQLLEECALVATVNNDDEQQDAVDIGAKLKTIEDEVEKMRAVAKRPFWDFGVAIDTAAKTFMKKLVPEQTRIKNLLSAYILKKRDEQRLAQELAEAEAQMQREDAARVQRENEAAAEKARLANLPPPKPVRVPEPVYAAPMAPLARVEGAMVREEYNFEVTDIHALYAWNALFVKLEVDRANLKAWLNMPGNKNFIDKVPGITVTRTASVSAKKLPGQKTIDIAGGAPESSPFE